MGSFFSSLVEILMAWLSSALNFLLDVLSALVVPLLEPVINLLPDLSIPFGQVQFYLDILNDWIALDWAFYLFGIYISIYIGFIIFKRICKLIPFIG